MLRVLPWKTQIVDELEPKTGELNSKAEFMASVSLPSPSNIKPEEIEWFFDNEKVESEDERFSTNVLEEHLHTFTVLKIEEEMMNKDVTLRIRDAETTAQLLVYIPPSPPKHVRIVSAKHDWAILQWDEPEARGSLPIIGYILECKVESGQWSQIGPELILGNRTEIDGLEGGLEHRFRVRAQTEYGIAAASLATDPLTPWVPLAVSKHLEEVTNCFEGDEKILKCKFTLTEDQEEAEWYLEDEKIDFTAEADRFENACDGGHWRALKIKKAELDDSGLYMCRIGDHLTETILEVLPKPAEFKVGFESGVAELNEDWEFKIEVDKPNQDVVWSKDGNQLHISGDKYITTWDDDFTHRLVIKNIQLEDQGHYLATIVGTESYCQGNLSVKVPEFQVKFESGTGDIGSDYTFKCQVDKPKAEVIWMKDGFELPSSDRYMVTWDDDFSTNLTIKNITLDDQGEYSAQIVDTPSICTAKLDIAVPTFDVAVRSGVADVGVDYTLNCKVDKPNVEVMWLKDGVKLPDSSRYITSWDDDFSTNLTIKNCRLDDQGEYSAVIVGTPSISVAMLDVAVPQFKIEFENGQAELASDWTFECKANANVEVEWFKDGIKLPSLDRYLVSCDDDLNHMLTIKDVREDDEGEYEAKIINTPTSCKAKLNVAIPQFDFQLEKAEVKKGGSHTFKCSLERQEVGLTWYKNGDALENDDKYKISTDGRWHYVEIRNVSIEDEGEYVARINGSSFESMAQLLVDMTKDPEVHTYQEIVEIIEVVQVPKVPKELQGLSPLPAIRHDDVLSDASDSDVGSVLSDDESEVDISEYGNMPTLPDMKSPAPGSVLGGLLGELKLQHKDLDRTASPFRAVPSPGLARVMAETPMSGTFSGMKTGTPLVDAVRERTAEEIVADIEHAARTPVPDDDILSDASGSISDGDVLSDGDSDADIDTAEEWELQQARIRSEAMHTIKEEETYVSGVRTEKRFTSEAVIQRKSRYTTEVAMQLVNEQVNVGEYEEVKIGEGEGINISVEFTGKPAPLATWVREGGLPDEATVTTTEESTTLAIETAESKHAGTYGLVLENEYGAQTAAFKVVLDSEKSAYMSTSEIMEEHYKEASFSKKPPAAINAEYGEELVLETEVNGQIVTVDWELEGSAEYFEGETVYKDGKTYSSLTIDAVTDETCGTYICTAMTNEKTFVTKTEVRLSKEKSAEEIEATVALGKGLRLDGSSAKYEELYEEGSFSHSSSKSMKKNVKITSQKKSQEEMFEIVLDHQEGNIKWKKGQVVSVKEKVSGDYWEVQVESRDGTRQTGAIKPWRLSEYQPGAMGENPSTIMKQLAWNEQEFKKSMHRINIQDTEIRGLLDQVMNSRTSLYGALQDSIVDAELLLNAMEPLEFAAHSHLIAATELKADVLSSQDLFELRKVKGHLMGWLVQLKSLLKKADGREARILVDALDATALMLHRADLLIMWGHMDKTPSESRYWGCPERQGKVKQLSNSAVSSNIYDDYDEQDSNRYIFLFPGRLAVCKRSNTGSGFQFVQTINFYNTQISRGYNGDPSAFELVNHEKGRVTRTAFQANSISQCDMWCRDIEAELRRAMLAQFNRPASAKGKPEITVGLEPITVRAGEPFELRAQVKGQPTPMVQWMKDRKNVIPSDDLVVTAKQGVYSLFVRKAVKADQGVYRVYARSPGGEAVSQANVVVLGK